MTQENQYYTAKQAQKVLGNITYSELSRYANRGRINRVVPPGKKQGFYSKTDVDQLAIEIEQFRQEIRIVQESSDDGSAYRVRPTINRPGSIQPVASG